MVRPDDTKQKRPKFLHEPDDANIYVHDELMKTKQDDQYDKVYSYPPTENPGNEDEHPPIQQRILKEIPELIE